MADSKTLPNWSITEKIQLGIPLTQEEWDWIPKAWESMAIPPIPPIPPIPDIPKAPWWKFFVP
jgi:hypothetical protein